MHNDLPQFSGYPENWHQICLTILKTSGVFTPILRVALKTMKCSNPIFLFSPQPLSFKTMNCFTPIFVASSSKNVRFWTRLFIIPLSLCPRNHKVSPCPKNHELFNPNFCCILIQIHEGWTLLFIIPLSLCPRNHKVFFPCPKNHELFYPNFC